MLRVIRYDTQTSVNDMEIQDDSIHIRLDNSGVLFLRSTGSTPNRVQVIVEIPQNDPVSYWIPALMFHDYDQQIMIQKQLYVLLPFLFFNYEKQLDHVHDPAVYAKIDSQFDSIVSDLKALTEQNILSAYESMTLYHALKVVVEALAEKHKATKQLPCRVATVKQNPGLMQ